MNAFRPITPRKWSMSSHPTGSTVNCRFQGNALIDRVAEGLSPTRKLHLGHRRSRPSRTTRGPARRRDFVGERADTDAGCIGHLALVAVFTVDGGPARRRRTYRLSQILKG